MSTLLELLKRDLLQETKDQQLKVNKTIEDCKETLVGILMSDSFRPNLVKKMKTERAGNFTLSSGPGSETLKLWDLRGREKCLTRLSELVTAATKVDVLVSLWAIEGRPETQWQLTITFPEF